MAYKVYLGKLLLPVTPEKITLKINNQNKTMNLINNGEINIIKNAGLTDIDFEVLLPNIRYPFAVYEYGFQNALIYLATLKSYKVLKTPFIFEVKREFPNGDVIFENSMLVTLESYSIIDDVSNGFDTMVSISLKEYRSYTTKIPELVWNEDGNALTETGNRETSTSPAPKNSAKSHTVSKGDTLWAISKKYYGNGELYPNIYEENKELIDGRNKGTGNDKYTIYTNQVFVIPI